MSTAETQAAIRPQPDELVVPEGLIVPNGNGHAPCDDIDFYGPFLKPEQIARRNPLEKNESGIVLELGDFALRITGQDKIEPNRHVRFIVNALLSEEDGSMGMPALYEVGFFKDAATQNSRQVCMSNTVSFMMKYFNLGDAREVLAKSSLGNSRSVDMSPGLIVLRLDNEDLMAEPQQTVSEPVAREHITVKTGKSIFGTEEVVEGRKADDPMYLAAKNFLEHGGEITHIANDADLRWFRKAMTEKAGTFERGSIEEERFLAMQQAVIAYQVRTAEPQPVQPRRTSAAARARMPQLPKPAATLEMEIMSRSIMPGELRARTETKKSRSTASAPIPSSLAALLRHQKDEDGSRRWQDEGNCVGVDPDLFFPERGASTREAKAVCRSCDVREDCLEFALAHGEKFGIWGGLSERERRRVRRQRALERRKTQQA